MLVKTLDLLARPILRIHVHLTVISDDDVAEAPRNSAIPYSLHALMRRGPKNQALWGGTNGTDHTFTFFSLVDFQLKSESQGRRVRLIVFLANNISIVLSSFLRIGIP